MNGHNIIHQNDLHLKITKRIQYRRIAADIN